MDVSIPLKLLHLHALPLSTGNTSAKTMPLQRQRSFPPTLFSFWQHPPIALNVFFSSPWSTTPTNQRRGKLLPLIRGQFSVPVTRSRDEAQRDLWERITEKKLRIRHLVRNGKGSRSHRASKGTSLAVASGTSHGIKFARQRKSSRAETDDFLDTHPNTF